MSEHKMQNPSAPAEVKTVTIDVIVACLNHRQRAAIVSKYEALKKPIKDSIVEKFPSLSNNLERYIASKIVEEANNRITSEKMPAWRGTILTFAPDLESKNETLKKAAEQRLESLRDEAAESDSVTELVKWYKVKMDKTSTDAHIVLVCAFMGIEASSVK